MRPIHPFVCVLAVAGAVLAGTGSPASAAAPAGGCGYTFLPTPNDTVHSGVTGGDRSGRFAVGSATVNPGGKPSKVSVMWQDGQQLTVVLPYADAVLAGINGSGVAVGTGTDAAGRWHAFVLDGGAVRELPSPDPAYETQAIAINDRGDVTGKILDPTSDWFERAVRWPAARPGTVEEVPVKGTVSAVDIDQDGTVLAQTGGSFTPGPAVAWRANGNVVELAAPGGGTSIAMAIANSWVAGWENLPAGSYHPIRWNLRNNSATSVPEVANPLDVNARGDVGGQDAAFSPVIRTRSGAIIRPKTPAGSRAGVVALSNRDIVYGFIDGRAVRWTGC